jgi:hypothetical protein
VPDEERPAQITGFHDRHQPIAGLSAVAAVPP